MFRAVRERWSGARGRRLAGLFAFEFVVVVLGVLAAQGVQTWAQARSQRLATDEHIARLEIQFGGAEFGARVWLAAAPCLKDRVEQVLRMAAGGGTLPAGFADRPKLGSSGQGVENEDLYDRIAARVGDRRAVGLLDMGLRRSRMIEGKDHIIGRWELFRLLDPAYGPPSTADRATVRVAAAEILAELRNIQIAAEYSLDIARRVPVTRRPLFDPAATIVPVRSCAEVWEKGTAYRMLDPGEAPPY